MNPIFNCIISMINPRETVKCCWNHLKLTIKKAKATVLMMSKINKFIKICLLSNV